MENPTNFDRCQPPQHRLLNFLTGNPHPFPTPLPERPLIGVLEGNGIGAEIIPATLHILSAIEAVLNFKVEIRHGGLFGEQAEARSGNALPNSTAEFCAEIFAEGGAILNGPGGGRYVYDLRRRFDLFCKFVPIQPCPVLAHAGRIIPRHLAAVDMLLVRDNTGGVYQGEWASETGAHGRVARHSFHYTETEVYRLIEVAARAAAHRRGVLHLVVKEGGVPGISALWREVGLAVARKYSVQVHVINVDLAAYELIQHPDKFDVLVAPNMIGDILADLAGVLVASRGLTFSGNYNDRGHAVYQTNHGCAHDLAGTDTANPAGQILSLAMLLRESFGLDQAAALIEKALMDTWQHGWRTVDIAEPGCRILGTRAMAEQIAEQIARSACQPQAA